MDKRGLGVKGYLVAGIIIVSILIVGILIFSVLDLFRENRTGDIGLGDEESFDSSGLGDELGDNMLGNGGGSEGGSSGGGGDGNSGGGGGGSGGNNGGNNQDGSGSSIFSIEIFSPAEASYGYTDNHLLNYTVIDTLNILDSCWYTLDNLANIPLSDCAFTYFNTSEGKHTLTAYANSTNGTIIADFVTFSVVIASDPVCGDGIIDKGELCDGNSQSCQTSGGYNGAQSCNKDCNSWNSCTSNEHCGDGIRNGNEECDGDDLGGETCQSQGYSGGTLDCSLSCSFDTTQCSQVGGGNINLNLQASRTSCVAPCGIFFDASETTADSTNKPFHELQYDWNFGDASSGIWAVTGKSKNTAFGSVAAHVYETPGAYQARLNVRDRENFDTEQITINVQNPDEVFSGTNTICFSQTGNFNGCPAGAQQITTSDYDNIKSNIATGKRLLLRRGETWQANNFNMQHPGPGIIGAFGVCQNADARGICSNNPILIGASFVIAPGIRQNQNNVDTYDWRFTDLVFTGTTGSSLFDTEGEFRDIVLLRVKSYDTENVLEFSSQVIKYWNDNEGQNHDLPSNVFVADSDFRRFLGGSGNNGYFVAAYNFATLGTSIMDSTGAEHVMRFPHVEGMVLSNNYAENPPSNKHIIKLHAPKFDGSNSIEAGRYGERVIISDNVFIGRNEQEMFNLWPQNSVSDERLRDVIFERNLVRGGGSTVVIVHIGGKDITLRNNIFDHSSMGGRRTIKIEKRGAEPDPTDVHVLSNTVYSSGTQDIILVEATASAINTFVKNNLAYSVTAEDVDIVVDSGSQNLIQSNNLAILDPPSPFVSDNPANAGDFALRAGSQAINYGAAISVLEDFANDLRPSGNTWDAGAYEFDLGLSPPEKGNPFIDKIKEIFRSFTGRTVEDTGSYSQNNLVMGLLVLIIAIILSTIIFIRVKYKTIKELHLR